MQSKRDQVQAHLFIMGRLASAMLRAEPDAPESPSGRTNRGVLIGLVLALLVSAGAFVFGLVKPGQNDSWKTSGELLVDKRTGARYLYLDGRLHPVRNYASALLFTGGDPGTRTVSGDALKKEPHGAPIGIPGAPDTLPDTQDADSGPWLVCSALRPGEEGAASVATALAIGVDDAADSPAAQGLGSGQALLVQDPDGAPHLVWQGSRLRLDEQAKAVEALGYGTVDPRPVSTSFLNSLPAGPDLAPPVVPGRGEPGPSLGGRTTRIGQVFRVDVPGADARYHLLLREGLAPLSATGAALVLGDPATRAKAYDGAAATVATLRADTVTAHLAPPGVARRVSLERAPQAPPQAVDVATGTLACTSVEATAEGPRTSVTVLPDSVLDSPVPVSGTQREPACLPVDSVSVRPGRGALVRTVGAGGNTLGNTTFLVTDAGVKFRVPSSKSLEALGFSEADAQTLPAPLLSLLPTGPDLATEAAATGRSAVTVGCGEE